MKSPVPLRERRWLWLAQVVRAATIVILIVPMAATYPLAVGIVAFWDWLGGRLNSFHVRCYNRDLARWKGAARRPGEARPDGWLP